MSHTAEMPRHVEPIVRSSYEARVSIEARRMREIQSQNLRFSRQQAQEMLKAWRNMPKDIFVERDAKKGGK